jgi:hypothetical protein
MDKNGIVGSESGARWWLRFDIYLQGIALDGMGLLVEVTALSMTTRYT